MKKFKSFLHDLVAFVFLFFIVLVLFLGSMFSAFLLTYVLSL